jgi:hypothetical protein
LRWGIPVHSILGEIHTKYKISYNSWWPRRHMVPAFMVHSFFGDGIILAGEIYFKGHSKE